MHTLYTYGYRQAPLNPNALQALAEQHNAHIVDIRLSPKSTIAYWRYEALTRRFRDTYHHLRDLGNINYKTGGPIQIANIDRGATLLLHLLEQTPCIILCACADYAKCHRATVALHMAEHHAVNVIHLAAANPAPIIQKPPIDQVLNHRA